MTPEFADLIDYPEAVPMVARWWFDAWGPTPSTPTVDMAIDVLRRELHRDELPLQMVAVDGGEVIGVAVLKEHEMQQTFPHLKYWVGNVYVRPESRGRRIASALLGRLAGKAHGMGITQLHLATERLDGGLYARCGYDPLERTSKRGVDVLVMARVLDEPVRLAPHDPQWTKLFEEERAHLELLVAPWLVGGIEHIGSTSVPGLVAKPVIDVMVGVETLDASRPAIARLSESGYCYFEYRPDLMHWFCKPSPWKRTHHVHLVPFDGPLWKERLAFRDRLREDRGVAMEYAKLKQRLAREHEFDREAYTDGKGPFVQRVLDQILG